MSLEKRIALRSLRRRRVRWVITLVPLFQIVAICLRRFQDSVPVEWVFAFSVLLVAVVAWSVALVVNLYRQERSIILEKQNLSRRGASWPFDPFEQRLVSALRRKRDRINSIHPFQRFLFPSLAFTLLFLVFAGILVSSQSNPELGFKIISALSVVLIPLIVFVSWKTYFLSATEKQILEGLRLRLVA